MIGVPEPGTMRLCLAEPNPKGAEGSQLFLFAGDAKTGPIQTIDLDPGTALPGQAGFLVSRDFSLCIYHFNDLHGHLIRFTQEGEEAVLPRVAWQIQTAREECRSKPDTAVLVFSAGDDITGSIFDEILAVNAQAAPIHPGYHLYSNMGVDVAGIGNHDLDRGLSFLADVIQHNAQFPVLAANLRGCQKLSGMIHPTAILTIKGVCIGLIGLVTRAETHLDPNVCQILDPVPVVNNLIPAIRPLCDVLIIISHLGYGLERPVPMADAGDLEVAHCLPYGSVDLIIGGHSHTTLNREALRSENLVNGFPIVQTGANGEYLGQVDLTSQKNSATVTAACLIPIANLPIDNAFVKNDMQPFITQVRDLWDQTLGQVETIPDLNTKVVQNGFAKRELPLTNLVTDALVYCLTHLGFCVDFAMIDASALQCGLPFTDNLTYVSCFEMMPYADILQLYQITGRQLAAILADNALRLDRPGENHIERGFLQFSRTITYVIRVGKTRPDVRALEMKFHETPLEIYTERTFTVSTTNFTRALAAKWETEWNKTHAHQFLELHQYPFTNTCIPLRREVIAYLQDHGGVSRAGGATIDGRVRVMR